MKEFIIHAANEIIKQKQMKRLSMNYFISDAIYVNIKQQRKVTLIAKSSIIMKTYVTQTANVIIEQQLRAILRNMIKHR